MRSFIRTRYGCDYCKKIGGSSHHMRKHEAGCTNNPNRVCSMHRFATCDEELPPTMQDLLEALSTGGYTKLKEISHDCPACKLAALRQSWTWDPSSGDPWPEEPQDGREKFNFKEEVKAMWDQWHESEREQHGYY